MTLVIVKDWEDPIIQIIEDAKKKEVINTYQGRVYDLGDTTIDDITANKVTSKLSAPRYNVEQDYTAQLSKTDEDDEIANPTPKPKIGGVSNDGVVGIRFNTPMVVIDLSKIQNSQVALRTTQAVKSTVETKQFLTEDGYSDFQIRNGIDVRIESADGVQEESPVEVNFSYEIIKFTEWEAEIQIHFDKPEAVSPNSCEDP